MWLVVSKPTQFAAVWRLIASSHIEKNEGGRTLLPSSMPLFAYCAHLSLGDAWNKVFFGTKSTIRGLYVIFAFWGFLWLTAYLFYREDPRAGLLLLPTCMWVAVAAALNWAIHILNSEKRG
jgi:tryptophan-rich sensory protein